MTEERKRPKQLRTWLRITGLALALILVTTGQLFFMKDQKEKGLRFFVPGLVIAVISARGKVPRRKSEPETESQEGSEGELVVPSPDPRRKIPIWLEIILVLLVISVGFGLRFYKITEIPPCLFDDESNTAYDAVKAMEGYYPNIFSTGWYEVPTLYSHINSMSFRLFGINMFAARATALALGTLTVAAMYFFFRILAFRRF